MSQNDIFIRGLKNVAACQTRISFVDPLGALYYSGHDIDRLIGRVCYEEVVHLLLRNKLPNKKELDNIRSTLISEMKVSPQIIKCLKQIHEKTHPMEALRTAVSHLSESDSDPKNKSESANQDRALKLVAKIPTIVANLYRIHSKQDLISPKEEYGFAENFLYMFQGKTADLEEIDSLDRYLILHADHGLNASTFAARVTASTLSDIYSAVVSAIGTLRGKLHGGASERVMKMLLEVDNVEEVVRGLRKSGVVFEQYDLPGMKTDELGIAALEGVKGAWFKDTEASYN